MPPYRTIPSNEEPKEAKLEVLQRSKYSLLKNEEDLTETQKIKLEAIKETLTNLKKMHELKEEFRKIYETSENPTEGDRKSVV